MQQKLKQFSKGTRKNTSGKRRYTPTQLVLGLLILVLLTFIARELNLLPGEEPPVEGTASGIDGTTDTDDLLKVTYLDVGQADCTILQWQDYAMLIDAGRDENADFVLDTLEELGIDYLDYVIATHSHEDHIGAMDEVLYEVPSGCVLYPKETADNSIYRRFLKAAKQAEKTVNPQPGDDFKLGDLSFTVLAPEWYFEDSPNNASLAVRLEYGDTSFLFTGDALSESETAMLQLEEELESDVFQAGHHGSSTSNTKAFLKEVDPTYVIISCGEDNEYGHPHWEVIASLEEMDVQVYRTDRMGTITVLSDGTDIHVSTEGK